MLNCPKCKTELILIPILGEAKSFELYLKLNQDLVLIPAPIASETFDSYLNEINSFLKAHFNLHSQPKDTKKEIKKILIEKELTSKDIADKLNVDTTYISKVINNKQKPAWLRKEIAEILNISVTELWPE